MVDDAIRERNEATVHSRESGRTQVRFQTVHQLSW
jgi:hypothetical protein